MYVPPEEAYILSFLDIFKLMYESTINLRRRLDFFFYSFSYKNAEKEDYYYVQLFLENECPFSVKIILVNHPNYIDDRDLSPIIEFVTYSLLLYDRQ